MTHSQHLATVTRVYLAGPVQLVLRILFVIVLARVARALARRGIDRVTGRVTLGKDASGEAIPAAGRRAAAAAGHRAGLGAGQRGHR